MCWVQGGGGRGGEATPFVSVANINSRFREQCGKVHGVLSILSTRNMTSSVSFSWLYFKTASYPILLSRVFLKER